MTIVSRQEARLDDYPVFELWVELGSLNKVSKHLANSGMINARTGLPFSEVGVAHAAYRWVLKNHEEAREVYIEHGAIFAEDDTEWEEWLVRKAMFCFKTSRRRFFSWIRRNDFEKYEYVYGERFPQRKRTVQE